MLSPAAETTPFTFLRHLPHHIDFARPSQSASRPRRECRAFYPSTAWLGNCNDFAKFDDDSAFSAAAIGGVAEVVRLPTSEFSRIPLRVFFLMWAA